MTKLKSFRDLRVYQELRQLHLVVHEESLRFPKFELYELGSQIRRSSNSAPANVAEGWASRHTNVYIECINRALGEIQETQHHLSVAKDKGYMTEARFLELDGRYKACCRMLEKLHQALSEWHGTTRTGYTVREHREPYAVVADLQDWEECLPDDSWAETLENDQHSPRHPTPGT